MVAARKGITLKKGRKMIVMEMTVMRITRGVRVGKTIKMTL